jgi:HTH-type transcriptional regulator, sugar sensing transcriptional regulator
MPADRGRALTELGLTPSEAAVYLFLVEQPGATGYKIAKAIKKPVANTYKVLESLHEKGAVLADEGEAKQYRAVPPEEFLGRLERQFMERRRRASRDLAGLKRPARDDRVYSLRSSEQVMERARLMLAACTHIALVDAFPGVLETLREDLAASLRRGVRVVVHTYRPLNMPGIMEVPEQRPDEVMSSLPGDHVSIVIDGREYLVAMLRRDGPGVFQAVWTQSVILAAQQHVGMNYEFMLAEVERKLRTGEPSAAELRGVLKPFDEYFFKNTPGREDLEALSGQRAGI